MQDWSQLAGMLGGLFQAGMPGSTGSANGYMNQIPGYLKQYYSPYINAGLGELPSLQSNYGALTSNPGGFINSMGKSFQQSPGYQFQTSQALGAANRAAAAGGMVGSPQEQQNIAGVTNSLANQDYYNYLNHSMNAYGMGLQGEQGLYNTGFEASNDLASSLAQSLMSQANLNYAGQINQNQQMGGGLGFAASSAGSFF